MKVSAVLFCVFVAGYAQSIPIPSFENSSITAPAVDANNMPLELVHNATATNETAEVPETLDPASYFFSRSRYRFFNKDDDKKAKEAKLEELN